MNSHGTTHRCLLIPEILSLVCAAVSLDDVASSRRLETLAALARTSRLFQEPALDCLWSELSTIAPLVKCMPSDLWREERVPNQRSSELSISRPIKSSDWSRFLAHASRVKKFGSNHVDRPHTWSIGTKVYQALSVATPTTILLPNVQELHWFPGDNAILSFTSLLLGPHLRTIELSLRGVSEVIGLSLLGTLNSRLPSLRYFQFYYEADTPAVADVISATVCGWAQLREVEVSELTRTALMHIGRLPHLRRLSCMVTGDAMPAAFPPLPESHWFPQLKCVFIQSEILASCSFLVEAMSSSPIRTFALSHLGSSDSLGWRHMLKSIGDYCNKATLTSVNLWDDEDDEPQHDADILTIEDIRPLFTFSRLYSVSLSTQEGIDIDDANMKELAKAWPQLSCFSLGTPNTAQRKPRVTLAGLIPLARYCRDLLTVSINIDASDVNISEARPAGGTINASFDCLNIGDSPISDPIPVAAFLSDIFPKIKVIYKFDGRDLDENSTWRQVGPLIPTFVSIRSQERNYEFVDESSDDESDH